MDVSLARAISHPLVLNRNDLWGSFKRIGNPKYFNKVTQWSWTIPARCAHHMVCKVGAIPMDFFSQAELKLKRHPIFVSKRWLFYNKSLPK